MIRFINPGVVSDGEKTSNYLWQLAHTCIDIHRPYAPKLKARKPRDSAVSTGDDNGMNKDIEEHEACDKCGQTGGKQEKSKDKNHLSLHQLQTQPESTGLNSGERTLEHLATQHI